MCNLFEPFDTYKPPDFQRFNHGAGMYVNGALSGEIYQIKYATVADYLWNSSAYDPERSLWKILCRDYGVAIARQLIIFNDAYYTFYGTCRRMELEGVDAARIRQGTRQLKHLEKQLQQLIEWMEANHPLVAELSRYCEKQRQRFAKLSAAGK
jgi:hypothetical protein